MASPDGPSGSEFMDDFYAECDEHLGDVRSGLLTLESAIGKQSPDPSILQRIFHTPRDSQICQPRLGKQRLRRHGGPTAARFDSRHP